MIIVLIIEGYIVLTYFVGYYMFNIKTTNSTINYAFWGGSPMFVPMSIYVSVTEKIKQFFKKDKYYVK